MRRHLRWAGHLPSLFTFFRIHSRSGFSSEYTAATTRGADALVGIPPPRLPKKGAASILCRRPWYFKIFCQPGTGH
jgi:hypothetical protein